MANRKVRVGQIFFYVPVLLDRMNPPYAAVAGDLVRVINLPGAPRANTMGHCYVELLENALGVPYAPHMTGRNDDPHPPFGGLVCTNSLVTKSEYIEYIRTKVVEHESEGRKPIPENFASAKLSDFASKVL